MAPIRRDLIKEFSMNPADLAPPLRSRLAPIPTSSGTDFAVTPIPPVEAAIDLGPARASHATALSSIGRADALAKAYPDHFFLSRILVRQEAVASSAIEGTHSTLDHLLEVEEAEDPFATIRTDSDAKQVQSYALALERALGDVQRNKFDAFSVGMIRDLQREVVKDDPTYTHEPGALRKRGHFVYIGGGDISRSTYNPAPPDEVMNCLNDQISYLKCAGMQHSNQSIVTRMALSHAHFEAVHPFPNGNGRTGRLILPLMLAADGHTPLYLAPYIAANRPTYMDALRAAQQRLEWVPIIEVIASAIISAVDTAERTHGDLFVLFSDWINRRKWRRGSSARRAIDLLLGHPVVTTKRLEGLLGISSQAAATAIKQLVAAKILEERTGFKRNRVFAATGVLKIYNRAR